MEPFYNEQHILATLMSRVSRDSPKRLTKHILIKFKLPPLLRALHPDNRILKVGVMDLLRVRFRTLAWIAISAIWLAALMPTFSAWVQSHTAGSDAWMSICSASTPGGQKAPTKPSQDHPAKGHCPFCIQQAHHLGLPPSPVDTLIRVDLVMATPELFLQAHQPLFAWAASQARAPPTQA